MISTLIISSVVITCVWARCRTPKVKHLSKMTYQDLVNTFNKEEKLLA